MKKILLLFCIFAYSLIFAQDKNIVINGTIISESYFKRTYSQNIAAEGLHKALQSLIRYELMRQYAEKQQADTTLYYKTLYKQNIAKFTTSFYDSLIVNEIKGFNLSLDSLTQEQKKFILQRALIKKNENNVIADSLALIAVNHFLGNDFLFTKEIKKFSGSRIIFKTPTSVFTQQDYYTVLLKIKKDIKNPLTLDAFTKANYSNLKNNFSLKDIEQNMALHFPNYKQSTKKLKNTILVNYFIEKEIYKRADNDSLGRKLFLNNNAQKYQWPTRYQLIIFRYQTPSDARKIERWLKQGKNADFIYAQLGTKWIKNLPRVVITTGKFPLPFHELGNLQKNRKIQHSTFRNAPAIIQIIRTIPPQTMTTQEAGTILKEDYRSFYFNKVLSAMEKQAHISIPNHLK